MLYCAWLIVFSYLDNNSADEVLLKPTGAQLTVEFLEEHSFSVPVMVLRRDGLGMTLPPSSFGVTDVEHYIGKVSL